jgi:hypothetical protein
MRRTSAVRDAKGVIGWLILLVVAVVAGLCLWPYVDHRLNVCVGIQDVRQPAQFHSIEAALELFANEFGSYPPSEANDVTGSPYCGAMKLVEAMIGTDGLGCHMRSVFRSDGLDPNGTLLYPAKPDEGNFRARRGPYLPIDNRRVFRLADVYGNGETGPYPEDVLVVCDTYVHKRPSGKKTGMPILYYRANASGKAHDPNSSNNIYDYRDNAALIALGVPGNPNVVHPLGEPKRFYLNTQDVHASVPSPYRRDSYILVSAGYDGLYGTADDICNFERH